ncbi:MAG: universal stress protein [Chloroflexi bacterium]|nr:MAG: universal stress protein [Chloroflexota bacterium]
MFKRILVPLDGSGRAERALPIAARLARATGGSIFLVRVLSTEPARLPSAPGKPNLVQTIGQADRALAESYLAGVAESELLTGIPVQTYVPVGLISPSILTMAAEKHADIIAMCSHGYTGVKRFADIPVLVLREGGSVPEERHPGERPLRVLVPLDGSDYARAALVPAAYLAAALAAPGRGALHLTHIVQPTNEGKAARATQNTQALLNMAKEYLEATIHYLREGSLDPGIVNLNLEFTSSVIVDDEIAQGILRVAEDGGNGEGVGVFGGCDAIAMTTQGYSGLQRWVGSVTERVLDTSRLPLLIVRPRE